MQTDDEIISMDIIEDEPILSSDNQNKNKKKEKQPLQAFFQNDAVVEIGVDEAGRGPLFGRVYTAAVILPKDDSFDHSKMKDSKTFHSQKKIKEVSDYIKENAIAWSIKFEDEKVIDKINILQATQKSMHRSILETLDIYYKKQNKKDDFRFLIDGNYFKLFPSTKDSNDPITYCKQYTPLCIERGDNSYSSIAAASILAKVARDQYIIDLCEKYPELKEKYSIDSNKGYGSKKHLDGINEHGISIWHRRSFGICKRFV